MYQQNIVLPSGGTNIDPNSFNDFNRMAFQNTQFTSNDEVVMFLYRPYVSPVQVSRPFVYQFDPEFIDSVKAAPTLEYGVSPDGIRSTSVYRAILPDSEGMVLNTSTLDQTWSFVLIINQGAKNMGAITMPGFRKIAMGYVIGEPINPLTNTHNPDAVFVFTHCNCRNVSRRVGMNSSLDGITDYTSQNVDYVNESTGMLYDQNILLGTPKEVMGYAMSDEAKLTGIMDYSPLQLSNVKIGQKDTKAINDDIKAPRHQLADIMKAIDNGIDHGQEGTPTLHRFMDNDDLYSNDGSSLSRAAIAQNTAYNNMPSGSYLSFVTGLDTSSPKTFGELDIMFPNLYVHQFNIKRDNGYGWNVAEQAGISNNGKIAPIMSARNQMSYLASMVVQAICGELGIAQVAFTYVSRLPNSLDHTPVWNMADFQLIIPRANEIVVEQAERFKKYVQNELGNVIMAIAGDFGISVMANMGGDVLINLELFNFPDPADGTYYQTSARFGGLMNPMIGTHQIINNNVMQLSNMTNSLVSNAFANDGMMMGATDMPLPEADVSF